MCRILGYSSPSPEETVPVLIAALQEFRMLAERGCVPPGSEPGHMDGWGVVAFKDNSLCLYYRSVTPAHKDENYESMLMAIEHTMPDILIIHLRKTSKGKVNLQNTQPFTSSDFALCHNGTIREIGDDEHSDSWYFFKEVEEDGGSREAFRMIFEKYDETKNYSAMNMLYTDGESLSATEWWNPEDPKSVEHNYAGYYTLWEMEKEKTVIVCSEPLKAVQEQGFTSSALANKSYRNYSR